MVMKIILAMSIALGISFAARPNIVFIMCDDMGWSDLGCYGGPVHTPTLDRLAAGGTRFTDFYSGAAVCSPSRIMSKIRLLAWWVLKRGHAVVTGETVNRDRNHK